MSVTRGWWQLTITSSIGNIDKEDELTLEQIAGMVKKGFTEGEIIQEKEVTEVPKAKHDRYGEFLKDK